MSIPLIPLLSYVMVSTFTPGPSNISSASVASLHGYRNTVSFQGGLAAGVFFVMLLSGCVSSALLRIFPVLEPVLRYVGAAYILYLALGILKSTYAMAEQSTSRPLGFTQGLMLQVLNPKLTVYAFTLFSAFLAPLANNLIAVTIAAALLAAISFSATSVWAIFGTSIKTHLHAARIRLAVNILFAVSLIYVAVALTGLL